MKKEMEKPTNFFEDFSTRVTKAAGSTAAFTIAMLLIIIWAISGPFFHFSETWQLVINTGTTIITFLMVFLIQKSQNKDSLAIQLKLNELVAAHEFASNRLVDVENMSEEELRIIQKYYSKLSVITSQEENLLQSHSIDEAHQQHNLKKQMEQELEDRIKNTNGTK
jgi:low affinity Fe/Cu permease